MRKWAPLMFAAGLVMILVQIVAVYGIIMGMMAAPCISNVQCTETGFYCQAAMDGKSGRCKACGQGAPLIPCECNSSGNAVS
jgi:hypothetical protein